MHWPFSNSRLHSNSESLAPSKHFSATQTGLRPQVEEKSLPSHQLSGNAGSIVGLSHLSARPEGTSCLSLFSKYDGVVLHKSPGWSFLEAPLYSSREPLEVGSAQLALAESSAHAGQTEPGSRHAISEQCPLRRVDAPPTNGSGNLGNLRQARGRPLRFRRQNSLPNLFFKGHGCVDPQLVQPPPLCFSSITLTTTFNRSTVLLVDLLWRNQHWFSELAWLLTAVLWPIPLRRDLLSQANGTIWHPQPNQWALHFWPLDESLQSSQRMC